MTGRDPTPAPQPTTPELVAYAVATRPDLDPADLEGAIQGGIAAHGWRVTQLQVARMIARDEDLHDLRNALRDPLGLKTRKEIR